MNYAKGFDGVINVLGTGCAENANFAFFFRCKSPVQLNTIEADYFQVLKQKNGRNTTSAIDTKLFAKSNVLVTEY